MSTSKKIVPEGQELKVLRALRNGYTVRCKAGKCRIGHILALDSQVVKRLFDRGWITPQAVNELGEQVLVDTKRGRGALKLVPEEVQPVICQADPRFGVVQLAPVSFEAKPVRVSEAPAKPANFKPDYSKFFVHGKRRDLGSKKKSVPEFASHAEVRRFVQSSVQGVKLGDLLAKAGV